MVECGEGSRHSRWEERYRKKGEKEEEKRDGIGGEEQVRLKQSPRHCDLCRPTKRSNQSRRNETAWLRGFTCLAQRSRCRCRGHLSLQQNTQLWRWQTSACSPSVITHMHGRIFEPLVQVIHVVVWRSNQTQKTNLTSFQHAPWTTHAGERRGGWL